MKALFRNLSLICLCALCLCLSVTAAHDGETLYNAEYCFTEANFSEDYPQPLGGIFVTAVPEEDTATVFLGNRTILPGDVLSAECLEKLRLEPNCQDNREAQLCYLPIYGTSFGEPAQLTIRIRSGKNEAPTAQDGEFETYKNIPNDGKLTATDPEGAPLTFQIQEQPKRGSVKLASDGSFVYTPNKNKVGEDSFTYTVTDEAGNSSQPATVKITILKPTEALSFADMQDSQDQFEALWLAENGLGGGRKIGEALCFCPEEEITRGEFLVMVMALADVPAEEEAVSCFADCEGSWLQGHLTAALRRGLINGESTQEGLVFKPNEPIKAQEAAMMLQNMLRLPVPAAAYDCSCDDWACEAVMALNSAGVQLPGEKSASLTRLEAAKLLYAASKLK